MHAVVVSGTGLYIPPHQITNEELVTSFNQFVALHNAENPEQEPLQESSAAFILKASGIERRYVMDKEGVLDPHRMRPRLPERPNDEPSIQCEMAVAAAREALAQAHVEASEVDLVVVACSNLQRPYPAVAVEVQAALGTGGYGFDMNVACSSATFGYQTAVDSLRNGSCRAALVLNPEICSGHLNFRDRDSHFIFGDACTASVLTRLEDNRNPRAWEVVSTRLKTQYSNNIRNNFGFLNNADESHRDDLDKLFIQQGRKVFKEVCPMVADLIRSHLDQEGLEDPKRLWLHQANLSMNQLIAKRVLGREVTREQAPVILDEFANTSSAGSVIAFHRYRDDLKKGDVGVLCSFGAGYSVGSVILRCLN